MKKFIVVTVSILILLSATLLIPWPTCDSPACQRALDMLPKIYCPGCEWTIVAYTYGICLHGLCVFEDIQIWCSNEDEYTVTLYCFAPACPL